MPKAKPFPSAATGKGFFGWIWFLVTQVATVDDKACCSGCKKVMHPSEISSHYTEVHKAHAPDCDWFCKVCSVWTKRNHVCPSDGDSLYFGRDDIMGYFGPVTESMKKSTEVFRKAVPGDKKNCFKINKYWAHHNGPCASCVGRNPELSAAMDTLCSTPMTSQFGFKIHPMMRLKYTTKCTVCEEPGAQAPKYVLRVDNFSKHGLEEEQAVPEVACVRKDDDTRQFPALSVEEEKELLALFNGNRVPTVVTRAEYKALSPAAQEFYSLQGKTAILDVY